MSAPNKQTSKKKKKQLAFVRKPYHGKTRRHVGSKGYVKIDFNVNFKYLFFLSCKINNRQIFVSEHSPLNRSYLSLTKLMLSSKHKAKL